MKKLGPKCFKNGKNHGAIALLYPTTPYPPFLLMIHHEEMQLNLNRNPNPKGGYKSAIAPKSCLIPELWLLKCKTWLLFVFSADDSKKLVTAFG